MENKIILSIQELDREADKIINLISFLDNTFGEHRAHLKLAIIAGFHDAFLSGYKKGLEKGLKEKNRIG